MANGTNGTPAPAQRQGTTAQQGAPRQGAPRQGASGNPPRKADVIIQITRDISKKQEDVRNQTQLINSRLDTVMEINDQSKEEVQNAISKTDSIYNSVVDSFSGFKQELTYLATQNENIYLNLVEKLAELNRAMEELQKGVPVQEGEIAQRGAVQEIAEQATIDYDLLSDKIAERLPRNEYEAQETVIDYDLLSDKIADKMPAPVQQYSSAAVPVATTQNVTIDYDELSARVVSHIPVQENISTDYIASKVAEQIVIPSSAGLDIDYDMLAKKVAQYVGTAPAQAATAGAANIDYDYLADKVADKILASKSDEPVQAAIDIDDLADKVAERLLANKSEEPVQAVIDVEDIADRVADKILANKSDEPVQAAIDIDDIADRVAERLINDKSLQTTETEIDLDALADKVAERIPAYEQTQSFAAALPSEQIHLDEDEIADRIALKVGIIKAEDFDIIVDDDGCDSISKAITEKLNYDIIAAAISEKLRAALDIATNDEPDYDEMANRIGEKINVATVSEDVIADKAAAALSNYLPDIDTDEIADKVVNQVISALPTLDDSFADRVAQTVINSLPVNDTETVTEVIEEDEKEALDYDALAEKVAAQVIEALPKNDEEEEIELDYDALAEKVAAQVVEVLPKNENGEVTEYSETTEKAEFDYDTLAERVAAQVIEALPKNENGEVTEYSETTEKAEFDYDTLAERVAAQVIEALPKNDNGEVTEYSETTEAAEKAEIELDYDALAEKVAALVIEALPKYEKAEGEEASEYTETTEKAEFDYDALAERVAAQVLEGLPKNENGEVAEYSETAEAAEKTEVELDYDALAEKVATQVVNSLPENRSYVGGAVIASGGGISEDDLERVCGKISETSGERFDSIDKDLDEIKAMLENGVQVNELAPAAAEQTITEDNDVLVTVSDVVSQSDASQEETYEEDVCDPKTQPSEDEENLEIGGEFSEASGGVDFINMMKYNRSFIARIIQGTDEQKEYYGRIKNALLSYKKVNSNIAWGAERFHKGRETIARLKIRGKTLVLYLALDPAEFPYSVYHHKDVSDNKSLHGTPLSVKVMSPLGVKKAIRLIDAMLEKRDGIKRPIPERDYADMYPYESIEELIEEGLVQDVRKP